MQGDPHRPPQVSRKRKPDQRGTEGRVEVNFPLKVEIEESDMPPVPAVEDVDHSGSPKCHHQMGATRPETGEPFFLQPRKIKPKSSVLSLRCAMIMLVRFAFHGRS